mmetsp:Transcript_33632/g.76888  ORF Transcript_33632/g.76888 Transcript_33632/m.76888 type:complete len:141 (+) Transcript_33632:116-538(+)
MKGVPCSAGARFGNGVYFGDNSGKMDQYCDIDKEYSKGNLLHQMIYPEDGNCRHPGDVFYALVCRVTLGCSRVYKGSGDFHPSARHTNELCDVPGVEPPLPHHSLIARKATTNVKDPFDEYIIFHSDLTYPEYLVAYQRR